MTKKESSLFIMIVTQVAINQCKYFSRLRIFDAKGTNPTSGAQTSSAATSFDTIDIDIMGPYQPIKRGKMFFLILTDLFSKFIESFLMQYVTSSKIIILQTKVFVRLGYR